MPKRALALVVVLVACRPVPVVPQPPSDRDGPGTVLGDACGRLRELGCPEGSPTKTGRTCYEHFEAMQSLGAEVPGACIADATSQDAVRACGDVNASRVRCRE